MKATSQPIPEHLKNIPVLKESVRWLYRLFWELRLEKDHRVIGEALRIPPLLIEQKLYTYGFEDYEIHSIKNVIFEMDERYKNWDYARGKAEELKNKSKVK